MPNLAGPFLLRFLASAGFFLSAQKWAAVASAARLRVGGGRQHQLTSSRAAAPTIEDGSHERDNSNSDNSSERTARALRLLEDACAAESTPASARHVLLDWRVGTLWKAVQKVTKDGDPRWTMAAGAAGGPRFPRAPEGALSKRKKEHWQKVFFILGRRGRRVDQQELPTSVARFVRFVAAVESLLFTRVLHIDLAQAFVALEREAQAAVTTSALLAGPATEVQELLTEVMPWLVANETLLRWKMHHQMIFAPGAASQAAVEVERTDANGTQHRVEGMTALSLITPFLGEGGEEDEGRRERQAVKELAASLLKEYGIGYTAGSEWLAAESSKPSQARDVVCTPTPSESGGAHHFPRLRCGVTVASLQHRAENSQPMRKASFATIARGLALATVLSAEEDEGRPFSEPEDGSQINDQEALEDPGNDIRLLHLAPPDAEIRSSSEKKPEPLRVLHVGPYNLRENLATSQIYDLIERNQQRVGPSQSVQLKLVEANPRVLSQLRTTIRVRHPQWRNSTTVVNSAVVLGGGGAGGGGQAQVSFYFLEHSRLLADWPAVPKRVKDGVGVQAFLSAGHLVEHTKMYAAAEAFSQPIEWAKYVERTEVPAVPGIRDLVDEHQNPHVLIVDTPNAVELLLEYFGEGGGVKSRQDPHVLRFHWFWGLGYASFAEKPDAEKNALIRILDVLTERNFEVFQHWEFFYAVKRHEH
eukprot:g16193.t1